MVHKKETQIGSITVSKNVISQIVSKVAAKFEKKVVIGDYRKSANQIAYKMGAITEHAAIEVVNSENGMDIRVYVMVKFGTSINHVTKIMIEGIHDEVEKIFGEEPNSVAVIITGIISKHVVKRNIEVTGK